MAPKKMTPFSSGSVPILLASSSPRRIQFMNQVHFPIEVHSPGVDEKPRKNESPRALVTRLAREKAESLLGSCPHPECLIIAADTIVVTPDGKRILGKPKDEADAAKMLKLLSGKRHRVQTGYCILHVSSSKILKTIVNAIESKVKIRSLTPLEIKQYIASGEPMDKAGAYAAQGLGMILIEEIQGSYTNVVGLPMAQIFADLENEFHIPLFSWMT